MDGQGNQEVKKYVLCFFVLAAIFSASVFALQYRNEGLQTKRLALLIEEHPELEGEVVRILKKRDEETAGADDRIEAVFAELEKKYGYRRWEGIWTWDTVFWLAGGWLVLAVVLYALWRMTGQKNGGDWDRYLIDVLEQFRCGDYSVPDACFTEKNLSPSEAEKRSELTESLKELGAYFSDLKERYGQEEADTKALITNISHQLKTPLASIRMSHELAVGDYASKEERQEFMEQEEAQIAKLQELVDELVKLSRLEKNMITLSPVRAGIKQTITGAVSQIYPKAYAKRMEIGVELTEDTVICHDVKWTTEALVNVLDNAVKYSGAGKHIFIRVNTLTQYVLVEIEDEGIGIPREELHKIYHRFYRGSNIASDSEGAGVGLYLARWIIETQGGTITAKNNYGGEHRGTVFQIMLPI